MTLPHAKTTRRPNSLRRARTFLFTTLLATLLLQQGIRTASAQGAPEPDADEVVRVNADLVTIPVSVTDARGLRVAGLALRDFEVLDNGQRVEAEYFAAGAERVALLFLLDASGSTRDIITQQRETALAIFSRFGASSRVAVMQFRERAELALPFTSDLKQARTAFQIAALPNRRTAIFDAAHASLRAFASNVHRADERRIVVLISDGLDNASKTRAAAVIKDARSAGVSFYVIHIPLFEPSGGRLVTRRPSKGFRDLATKTGGQVFVVGDARSSLDPRAEHDLSLIFQAIADDLAGQYVLGYHASAAATQAGQHRVEVRVKNSVGRKLRVRQLREGYESKQ